MWLQIFTKLFYVIIKLFDEAITRACTHIQEESFLSHLRHATPRHPPTQQIKVIGPTMNSKSFVVWYSIVLGTENSTYLASSFHSTLKLNIEIHFSLFCSIIVIALNHIPGSIQLVESCEINSKKLIDWIIGDENQYIVVYPLDRVEECSITNILPPL